MFCCNCGKELTDDSRFCEYCGTPTQLDEYPPRQETAAPSPAPEKKPRQKKPRTKAAKAPRQKLPFWEYLRVHKTRLIVLGSVLAVLIAAAVLFCLWNSPASIAERYCKATMTGNIPAADRCTPYDDQDYALAGYDSAEEFFAAWSEAYDTAIITSFEELCAVAREEQGELLERGYGGDWKATAEAVRSNEVTVRKFCQDEDGALKAMEECNVFDRDAIDEVRKVTVTCKIKGEDNVARTTMVVTTVRTGVLWKVMWYDLPDDEQQIWESYYIDYYLLKEDD